MVRKGIRNGVSKGALQTVYALLVMGLLAWPVPHYYLSRGIVSDPWKNFGLAMYATYYELGVHVRVREEGQLWQEVVLEGQVERLVLDFVEKRRTRGTTIAPNALASELHPLTGGHEMQILVNTRKLDAGEGRVDLADRRVYDYRF